MEQERKHDPAQGLITFLRSARPGADAVDLRAAGEALAACLRSRRKARRPQIEAAVRAADKTLLDDIGAEVGHHDAVPPSPLSLGLVHACARAPGLLAALFMRSFEEHHESYFTALRDELVERPDEVDLAYLAAMLLEHIPRFVEEDAFDWLASPHPCLHRAVGFMWLTADAGTTGSFDLAKREELAHRMAAHPDPCVREAGREELIEITRLGEGGTPVGETEDDEEESLR